MKVQVQEQAQTGPLPWLALEPGPGSGSLQCDWQRRSFSPGLCFWKKETHSSSRRWTSFLETLWTRGWSCVLSTATYTSWLCPNPRLEAVQSHRSALSVVVDTCCAWNECSHLYRETGRGKRDQWRRWSPPVETPRKDTNVDAVLRHARAAFKSSFVF